LKSGTFEDQMAALRYLNDIPEETAIRAVYEMLISEQPEIKDAALLTVWYWALAGVQLPAPTLYGFTMN
jgi:hypothetical protein